MDDFARRLRGWRLGLPDHRATRGSRVHHQVRPDHHLLARSYRLRGGLGADRAHRDRGPADGPAQARHLHLLPRPLRRRGRDAGPVRQVHPPAGMGRTPPQGERQGAVPALRRRRPDRVRQLRRRLRHVFRDLRRRLFHGRAEGPRQDAAPRAAALRPGGQDRHDRRHRRGRVFRDIPRPPRQPRHLHLRDQEPHRRAERPRRVRAPHHRRQVCPNRPDREARLPRRPRRAPRRPRRRRRPSFHPPPRHRDDPPSLRGPALGHPPPQRPSLHRPRRLHRGRRKRDRHGEGPGEAHEGAGVHHPNRHRGRRGLQPGGNRRRGHLELHGQPGRGGRHRHSSCSFSWVSGPASSSAASSSSR